MTDVNSKESSIVDRYFDPSITDRERACFEAGIKLGAIFHSLIGLPVVNKEEAITAIQEGIIASFKNQPFVRDLSLQVHVGSGKDYTKRHEFDYTLIKEHMIDLALEIQYKQTRVAARIQWIPELGYPLMFLKEVK